MKLRWRSSSAKSWRTSQLFLILGKIKTNDLTPVFVRYSRIGETNLPTRHWRIDRFSSSFIQKSKEARCPSSPILRSLISFLWSNTDELEQLNGN